MLPLPPSETETQFIGTDVSLFLQLDLVSYCPGKIKIVYIWKTIKYSLSLVVWQIVKSEP